MAALPYNLDPATMAKAISSVSGVLFTGGGESLKPNTPYYKAASHIFKQVLEINDQGIPLPLWGYVLSPPPPIQNPLYETILTTSKKKKIITERKEQQTPESCSNKHTNRNIFVCRTCMGFQLLTLLVAEDQSVLDRYAFDSEVLDNQCCKSQKKFILF